MFTALIIILIICFIFLIYETTDLLIFILLMLLLGLELLFLLLKDLSNYAYRIIWQKTKREKRSR